MKTPDHYAALNLSPGAGGREIARAYRVLLRRHHPDMDRTDGGPPADPVLLQQVMDAYSVLSDPERRAGYDRSREKRQSAVPTPRPGTGPVVIAGPIVAGPVIVGPVVVEPFRREGQPATAADHQHLRRRLLEHRLLECRLLDALGYRDRW